MQDYDKAEIELKKFINPNESTTILAEYVRISGCNQEGIGYHLGKIGKEVFNSMLFPFADEKFAKEKEAYIESVDTIYARRIKGIQKALDLENDYTKDASYPVYDYRMPGCSSILVPAKYSANGHTLIARNVDWYETEVNPVNGINKWAYVVDMYPNDGMATLALGSTSIIGAPYDVINEHGIYLAGLADQYTYTDPLECLAGANSTRFNHTQIVRSLIENAKTLDEAKQHIIKIGAVNMAGSGMHFLLADKEGNALVIEYDDKTRELVLSEFNQEMLAFTNSPLRINPSSRLEALQPENSYDDFYRYNTVNNFVINKKDKVNEDELWQLMANVAADSNIATNRGMYAGTISRLYWTVIVDLDAKTMAVRYNLGDGEKHADGKRTNLRLSDTFNFKLNR